MAEDDGVVAGDRKISSGLDVVDAGTRSRDDVGWYELAKSEGLVGKELSREPVPVVDEQDCSTATQSKFSFSRCVYFDDGLDAAESSRVHEFLQASAQNGSDQQNALRSSFCGNRDLNRIHDDIFRNCRHAAHDEIFWFAAVGSVDAGAHRVDWPARQLFRNGSGGRERRQRSERGRLSFHFADHCKPLASSESLAHAGVALRRCKFQPSANVARRYGSVFLVQRRRFSQLALDDLFPDFAMRRIRKKTNKPSRGDPTQKYEEQHSFGLFKNARVRDMVLLPEDSSSYDDEEEEERSYFDVADVAAALSADSSCRRLRRLTLFGCGLKSLRNLPLSPRLRSLTLSSNDLGPVLATPELCGLSRLEELDVSSNRLRKTGSGLFASLRTLSVAYNRFVTLDGLDAPLLEHIDARNNLIEEKLATKAVVILEGNPVLRKKDLNELHAKTKHLEEAFMSMDQHHSRRLKGMVCVVMAVWTKAKIARKFDRWKLARETANSARSRVEARIDEEAKREEEKERFGREMSAEIERNREERERIVGEARIENQKIRDGFDGRLRELVVEHETALKNALEEQKKKLSREHEEITKAERQRVEIAHEEMACKLREEASSALKVAEERENTIKLLRNDVEEREKTIEALRNDASKFQELAQERDAAVSAAQARDSSARLQLSELRSAFERSVVTAAENKASSQAAETARSEMAARLSEAADLTRTQQAALSQARKARDEARKRFEAARDGETRAKEACEGLQKVADDLRKELASIGESWRDEKAQRAEADRVQRAAFEDRHAACLASFAAAQRDHRENARRVLIATEAAEAARDEAARRESLASDLAHKLDQADAECQDLIDENNRLREARDALSGDRDLLKSDLDKCESRLKAQLHIEQHLRSVVAELRQRSTTTNIKPIS